METEDNAQCDLQVELDSDDVCVVADLRERQMHSHSPSSKQQQTRAIVVMDSRDIS